jgi:hypothetical protein
MSPGRAPDGSPWSLLSEDLPEEPEPRELQEVLDALDPSTPFSTVVRSFPRPAAQDASRFDICKATRMPPAPSVPMGMKAD